MVETVPGDGGLLAGVLLWVLGVVAVVSGALVFRVDSMARATYALAVSFVAVGAVVLLLRLDYVGIIVVLMMIMEMAIMAVFMVMYMGMNPALMPMSMVHDNRKALVAAVSCFVLLAGGALLVPWPVEQVAPAAAAPAPADTTASLGFAIMESKMLVMMTISPVMVATIVAGVVLSAPRGRYERYGDDLSRRPADDPQPGPPVGARRAGSRDEARP